MAQQYDVLIRGGMIIDGHGGEPFLGDIAVNGEVIVAIGKIDGVGRETIDATGMLVTPGFVDVHTHYDAQVIWESRLAPSSGHGVTTVVMGNCGVGFAPCRRDSRRQLVELMEGVEDIPEVVMDAGLSWNWESFPEYLDQVEAVPHDINVAAYIPHAPLRVYAMGDRAGAGVMASPEEIATMARLTGEAVRAGAIGFSTSRTLFHRSSTGDYIPTRDAAEEELTKIAEAVRSAGGGILQFAQDYKDYKDIEGEFEMMKRVMVASGCPMTLPTAQVHSTPDLWRDIVRRIEDASAEGLTISAQILPRGVGMLLGLELTMHPFCLCPSYGELASLPLAERVQRMRDPAVRARILADTPADTTNKIIAAVRNFDAMYEGGDPIDYEPDKADSIGARARRDGVPPEQLAYEILLKREGRAMIYMPFANYAYGNLDDVATMMGHENFVLGLGDGGAHLGSVCDGSYSTFMLSHWTRDRKQGRTFSVPRAVQMLSRDCAQMMGLKDRGELTPGYRADINVIDYEGLRLDAPIVTYDLPGGGRRLVQNAEGYVATLVNGRIICRNDQPTDEFPGKLLRGRQAEPASLTRLEDRAA